MMKADYNDEFFMREALLEAKLAAQNGEVPVGAVLVEDDRILARAHNESVASHDPTAHAEILAIRKASYTKKNYRIPGCSLYVTLEPCAMCLGAVVQARIKKLVYGAADPKSGAVRSIMEFPIEKTNHSMEVAAGVLDSECRKLLKDFFKERR
jgi:tRNA(adenine34) deaminase